MPFAKPPSEASDFDTNFQSIKAETASVFGRPGCSEKVKPVLHFKMQLFN
jgi:hypothetical protein